MTALLDCSRSWATRTGTKSLKFSVDSERARPELRAKVAWAAGQGETAESWVGTGPNKQVTPAQLEQAIGPEVLATLSKQTGLSRDELLARLSRALPAAVDKYTPHGRLPTEAEFSRT